MSQTTCTFTIEIDDQPATGLTVLLSDPTAAYGVKRNDTGAVVVADATALTELGGGTYSHTFTDPAADLTYTAYAEYAYDGETYRVGKTFAGTAADANTAAPTRRWEAVISYEDRSTLHTSRWRLGGVVTKSGALNSDNGVIWLKTTRVGDTVTAELYKDDGLAAGDKVASGTADAAGLDGTGANAAEVVLTAANGSGLSGEFWIHRCSADGACPVQVALCTDEDLDALWDGIDSLSGYDTTYGMAEYIRLAGEDVLGRVGQVFRNALGGHGAAEAWFITDADRSLPDLRRIANPAQLRRCCAYRALEIGIGRDHQAAGETAYSDLRDRFATQYAQAAESLVLATAVGGSNAGSTGQSRWRRLSRG